MRITTIFAAAGLAAASFGISGSASAQSWGGNDRDGYRDGYRYRDRRHYDRRHYGWDRRHYGWDRRHYGWDRRCRTVWRYGHRVRICR